jgi:hypothetical protein
LLGGPGEDDDNEYYGGGGDDGSGEGEKKKEGEEENRVSAVGIEGAGINKNENPWILGRTETVDVNLYDGDGMIMNLEDDVTGGGGMEGLYISEHAFDIRGKGRKEMGGEEGGGGGKDAMGGTTSVVEKHVV